MSGTNASVQATEVSYINTATYCLLAVCAILVYDWLLCLGQEVRFIWNRKRSGVTISSLVYALSRYTLLIETLLSVATIDPMSDLSCRANIWTQTTLGMLGMIASGTFSALRAYALSNRNIWLAAIIVFLAIPPAVMRIVEWRFATPENLPSPSNCSASSLLSPTLSIVVNVILRGSQFAGELLVIGITWWYTYQSYRIRQGVDLGKTVSSLLLYNGSMYFLFLATLYILDIILTVTTESVSLEVRFARAFLETFIDPATSILTCHFMLALRQFDSTLASATFSGLGPRLQEHTASTVLQFAAQPSESLPALIASFAHPVHVDTVLHETDPDHSMVKDEFQLRDTDGIVQALEIPSYEGLAPDQLSKWEHAV